MTTSTREIHLASRPTGLPTQDNFLLVETTLADPAPGELLVHNSWMSVDPYMRGRMNETKSYVPPFQLGAALEGGAVGVVAESAADGFKPGDLVLHWAGWREHAVIPAASAQLLDPALAPPQAFLGVLGMPGMTAYAGLLEVAAMKEGDRVFVSGAAGAVGSLVGQIAKLRGASRVVGSAGSDEKVAWLTERAGFDAAFNYKSGPVSELLTAAAPDGVDVYFDNVGGEHLEAAITALRPFGRIAACGMISIYNNAQAAPGPRNMAMFIGKRLTLRGFIVSDFGHVQKDFLREVGGWLASGQVVTEETVVDGLASAPEAFLGLMAGTNTGKMLVRLS